MKLVDDVRGIWRHFSTWALTVGGALQGVWLGIPDSIRASLPPYAGQAVAWITLVVAIWGIGGKMVKQDLPAPPAPKEPAP